jgi:hypothetical protein
MSTLNVTNLAGPSNTGTAATLSSINGGPISGTRNRIINGDMRIDQRNAGAAVAFSGGANGYCLDRWFYFVGNGGAATVQRSSVAPPGFTNSLLYTVTTADASVAAGDYATLEQKVEGVNVADFAFGTAAAGTVTLSFWVRSSVIGTYYATLRGSANNRVYVAEYSIGAANTWERKTLTIPGDTSGVWYTDSGVGVHVNFCLMVGSNWQQAAGSWGSTTYGFGSSNQTNLMATNGATFYLTGVQLEAGSIATPFERRSYGHELALCQRYFQDSVAHSTTGGAVAAGLTTTGELSAGITFKQSMRVAPSITLFDQAGTAGKVSRLNAGVSWNSGSSGSATDINTWGFWLSSGSGASGGGVFARFKGDAEL